MTQILSWAHLERRIAALREEYRQRHDGRTNVICTVHSEGALEALDRLRDEIKKEIGL